MKLKSLWFEKLNGQDINDILKMQFPIKLAYHLKRVFTTLRSESKAYYDQKKELFDKYGVNGKVPDKNLLPFTMEVSQLCEVEVDLNITPYQIKLEELPDMSVLQFEFIEPFLEIDNKKDE